MDPAFERITAFRGVTSNVARENLHRQHRCRPGTASSAGHEVQLRAGFKAILRDKSVNDTDYRYYPVDGQTYLLSSYRRPDLGCSRTAAANPTRMVPRPADLMAPSRAGYEAYFEANSRQLLLRSMPTRARTRWRTTTRLNEDIYAGYLMAELPLHRRTRA